VAHAKNFLTEFDVFDATQWESWLDAALSGNCRVISPERDEALQDYIIRVFKGVPLRQKDIFSQVLSAVITQCPHLESYAERWYILLKIAQVVRPPVQSLLRTMLATGFGNTTVQEMGRETKLQSNLLLVVAKYGVDDWLVEYIWKTSEKNYDDFEYGLLCMRILSWRLDSSCLAYHRNLIPLFKNSLHVAQYQPEFYLVIKRLGCRLVMNWFQTFITKIELFESHSFELWIQGFQVAHLRYKDDPYALSVLAELKARDGRFDINTLSELARVRSEREPDLIPNFMLRIKDTVSWEYDDAMALIAPQFAFPHLHLFRSKSFSAPLEMGSPELELLDRANFLGGHREVGRSPFIQQPTSTVH